MKLSTTFSFLTAAAVLAGSLLLAQQAIPDSAELACKNTHTVVQTHVLIGPELATYPPYLAGPNVGYGVFPTRDKRFFTSLPLGTCKMCKAAVVKIAVRRDKSNLGTSGSDNDDVMIGFARPAGSLPTQASAALFTQKVWAGTNGALSRTLTFTIPAAQLNSIIFNSSAQGYLNVYVEDDTTVDQISLTYTVW